MKIGLRTILFSLVMVLLIFSLASADLMVKSKMDISGIPMMGNMSQETTYYITKDRFATMTSMANPMMGDAGEVKTKAVVGDEGNKIVVIDYAGKTYTIFDQSQKEKIDKAMAEVENMLDSIKESVTIDKVEIKMTGNKKKILGVEATELVFDVKAKIMAALMGPDPMPINISFTGNMWGTKDFAEHAAYSSMVAKMAENYTGMSQGGLGSFGPILDKLGIDKEAVDEMLKFSKYVPLEGNMVMSIEMVMPEGAAGGMPGMNMNINMATTTEVLSKDAVNKAEFEIPEGFEESDMPTSKGGFSIPGFGQ